MSTFKLYEVLDLNRGATAEEVRVSYKRLALKHHPDKNPNDPTAVEKFKQICDAYQILSDEEKRIVYDTYGDQLYSQLASNAINPETQEAMRNAERLMFSLLITIVSPFDLLAVKLKLTPPPQVPSFTRTVSSMWNHVKLSLYTGSIWAFSSLWIGSYLRSTNTPTFLTEFVPHIVTHPIELITTGVRFKAGTTLSSTGFAIGGIRDGFSVISQVFKKSGILGFYGGAFWSAVYYFVGFCASSLLDHNFFTEWVENRLEEEKQKGNLGKRMIASFAFVFCKVMIFSSIVTPLRTLILQSQLNAWHEPAISFKSSLWSGYWMDVGFAFARNILAMYFIH